MTVFFSCTVLQTGHELGLSHGYVVGTETPHTNSPRVHVEHRMIAQGNSLTHREQPNGKSELQEYIYTQMQLEQICP